MGCVGARICVGAVRWAVGDEQWVVGGVCWALCVRAGVRAGARAGGQAFACPCTCVHGCVRARVRLCAVGAWLQVCTSAIGPDRLLHTHTLTRTHTHTSHPPTRHPKKGEVHVGRSERGMGYLIRLPKSYSADTKYPLLVYFHGGGSSADETGDDPSTLAYILMAYIVMAYIVTA